MFLFELLEKAMERCPINLQRNSSLQKTLSHGCKWSSAVSAHIPSQPAVLLLYFRYVSRIKEYLPTTYHLYLTILGGTNTRAGFYPCLSEQRSACALPHKKESSGIYRLALNWLNIFSRFSRLCWETKEFLCQEKSPTLWMGMDGQAGLILWANSRLKPLTQKQTTSLSTSEFRNSMQIILFHFYG